MIEPLSRPHMLAEEQIAHYHGQGMMLRGVDPNGKLNTGTNS